MKLAPIIIFVYNRPIHAQLVIEALIQNELSAESEIYFFSDGPKDNETDKEAVGKVREYLRSVLHFKKIHIQENEVNLGLEQNIIQGINQVFSWHEMAIILEDDTLPMPGFLMFMNMALSLYQNEIHVGTIQGFQFPIKFKKKLNSFFTYSVGCWGWATWKDRWALFEPNGSILMQEIIAQNLTFKFNINNTYPFTELLKNQIEGKTNSWAIRWYASLFIQNKLNYYPTFSLIKNIGNDASGTHKDKNDYSQKWTNSFSRAEKIKVEENIGALESIIGYRNKLKIRTQIQNTIRKIKINVLGLKN